MKLFLNGTLTDAADAMVSVFDYGFTMGVTVTEQIRTYGRRTPLLKEHLDRFFGGLKTVGLTINFTRADIENQIGQLIQTNGQSLCEHDELGIGVCATPGMMTGGGYAAALGLSSNGPTILIYAYPLARETSIERFETGVRLTSVSIQEISAKSIPKSLKCRSRMHYYLAQLQADAIDPGSQALLCDAEGFIAEGTTATVVMIESGRLVVPLPETVLAGVTLNAVLPMAETMGIEIERRNITGQEFENADEVLWLTTPWGILPVTHVNRKAIGNGKSRPVTQRLKSAWDTGVFQQ